MIPSKVKITVLKRFKPSEVFDKMPVTPCEHLDACEFLTDGQTFFVDKDLSKPEGFCTSAWVTIYPTIRVLGFGGNLPWWKEKGISISCCSDGLRPVIFKLERV